jgi:hypothetical protein
LAGFIGLADAGIAPGDTPRAVVYPASPTAAETHSAIEVSRFLGMILGETIPLSKDNQPHPVCRALQVGRTADNLSVHDPDSWLPDTMYIGYGPGTNDIALIGEGDQGTLFAAHEFLRDLGCRWYYPNHIYPENEFIPSNPSPVLPITPKSHTPSFRERGWHPALVSLGVWYNDMTDWAVRNGLNALRPGSEFDYGSARGHGLQIRGGHTLPTLIPSGDFPGTDATFAAHPEWYPLVGGVRVKEYPGGRPVQITVSAPGAVAEVVTQAGAYLTGNPDVYRFSLSASDEPTYWSEIAGDIAMDGPNSTWTVNNIFDAFGVRSRVGPGPMSTRWYQFINQVADAIAISHPGRTLSTLAYASTVAPPRDAGWTLRPNVMIEYAFGDGLCLLHAADDATCPQNAAMNDWLTGWMTNGNATVFYDYPPTGRELDAPSGFTRRYAALIGYTHGLGLTGWSGEGQGSWAGSGLWNYLKARLLWDVTGDADALIDEYCTDVYGAAAGSMTNYYDRFEVEIDALPDHSVFGGWTGQLRADAVVRLNDMLIQANSEAVIARSIRSVMFMRVAMNALILNWLEVNPYERHTMPYDYHYETIRAETLQWITDFQVPVNDLWRDELVAGGYQPPTDRYDQVNGSPVLWDGIDGVSYGRWNGQSFTPDVTTLTAVEFVGMGDGHSWTTILSDEQITAQVWSMNNGVPDQLLAGLSRRTPVSGGWIAEWSGRFEINPPLDVQAYMGTPGSLFMAFGVATSSTTGEWSTVYTTGGSDDYPEGQFFFSSNQGGTWAPIAGRDLAFRTYGTGGTLTPTQVPAPDRIVIDFAPDLGSEYVLDFTEDIATDEWNSREWSILGNGQIMRAYDDSAGSASRNYRIRKVN